MTAAARLAGILPPADQLNHAGRIIVTISSLPAFYFGYLWSCVRPPCCEASVPTLRATSRKVELQTPELSHSSQTQVSYQPWMPRFPWCCQPRLGAIRRLRQFALQFARNCARDIEPDPSPAQPAISVPAESRLVKFSVFLLLKTIRFHLRYESFFIITYNSFYPFH
jgi:hypothetical protein